MIRSVSPRARCLDPVAAGLAAWAFVLSGATLPVAGAATPTASHAVAPERPAGWAATARPATPAPVRIALIDAFTGPSALSGQMAAEQAKSIARTASEARWAGQGLSFDVQAFDGRNEPRASIEALQAAIDLGIRFVVTTGTSSATSRAVAAAVAQYNGTHPGGEVLMLNAGADDVSGAAGECGYWDFQSSPGVAQRAAALAHVARESRPTVRRVFVVDRDDDGGRERSRVLRDVFSGAVAVAASGASPGTRTSPSRTGVAGEAAVPATGLAESVDDLVERIRASGADAVVTGLHGADLAVLAQALKQAGGRMPRLLALDAHSPALAGGLQGADGLVLDTIVASWTPGAAGTAGTAGHVPLANAMRLLGEAIRLAGTVDARAVAQRLDGLSTRGVGGPVWMRAADHRLQQSLPVVRWSRQDGVDGWRMVSSVPAAVTTLRTTCRMKRPGRA